jgi:hypothetical protein
MAFTCYECHDRRCPIHEPPLKNVGESALWPREQVYLPKTVDGEIQLGISVGPCEDCGKTRPCVNC